jgi:hypothetical protein
MVPISSEWALFTGNERPRAQIPGRPQAMAAGKMNRLISLVHLDHFNSVDQISDKHSFVPELNR